MDMEQEDHSLTPWDHITKLAEDIQNWHQSNVQRFTSLFQPAVSDDQLEADEHEGTRNALAKHNSFMQMLFPSNQQRETEDLTEAPQEELRVRIQQLEAERQALESRLEQYENHKSAEISTALQSMASNYHPVSNDVTAPGTAGSINVEQLRALRKEALQAMAQQFLTISELMEKMEGSELTEADLTGNGDSSDEDEVHQPARSGSMSEERKAEALASQHKAVMQAVLTLQSQFDQLRVTQQEYLRKASQSTMRAEGEDIIHSIDDEQDAHTASMVARFLQSHTSAQNMEYAEGTAEPVEESDDDDGYIEDDEGESSDHPYTASDLLPMASTDSTGTTLMEAESESLERPEVSESYPSVVHEEEDDEAGDDYTSTNDDSERESASITRGTMEELQKNHSIRGGLRMDSDDGNDEDEVKGGELAAGASVVSENALTSMVDETNSDPLNLMTCDTEPSFLAPLVDNNPFDASSKNTISEDRNPTATGGGSTEELELHDI